MTVEDVKKMLGLQPHPVEGGWFVRTYQSEETIPAGSFSDGRYTAPRRVGTAIYYLLEPGTFSEMHRLKSDEIYHFYMGDVVEMLQLDEENGGKVVVIGSDLTAGERPQVIVRHGVWQGSRLVDGGSWALLGCTLTPGFEFEDYEGGKRVELCARWPEFEELITALTRS
jgi:predicted cupin superfamily sugar epimerase